MPMQQFILYAGFFIAILGVAVLLFMAYKAKTYKGDDSDEARAAHYQKLILLNFVGLGFGVIGLILIVLQRIF